MFSSLFIILGKEGYLVWSGVAACVTAVSVGKEVEAA